jgi:hypothetical protein
MNVERERERLIGFKRDVERVLESEEEERVC